MPFDDLTEQETEQDREALRTKNEERRVVPTRYGVKAAPTLNIVYECPREGCRRLAVLDAYRGPPSCQGSTKAGTDDPHTSTFMIPRRIADDSS